MTMPYQFGFSDRIPGIGLQWRNDGGMWNYFQLTGQTEKIRLPMENYELALQVFAPWFLIPPDQSNGNRN